MEDKNVLEMTEVKETAQTDAQQVSGLVTKDSALPVGEKFMAQKANVLKENLVPTHVSYEYTKGTYRTPVQMGVVTAFGSRFISPAHQRGIRNSVDFYVPEGIQIRSPADGIINEIVENSKSSGMSTKYWLKGNGVGIKCPNGEHVWMEHLQHGFATKLGLKIGQEVKACDIVGISGNTGFTENPHIHMEVLRFTGDPSSNESVENGNNYVTLKIRFDERDIPFDLYLEERKKPEEPASAAPATATPERPAA
ncbi:Peptidase family M23 [uncultured archaeon]|nr:Peptidase family M23 [uncultured archaeon]